MVIQGLDEGLRFLLDFLRDGKQPDECELAIGSSEQKYYWVNKYQFVLKQGMLVRLKKDS